VLELGQNVVFGRWRPPGYDARRRLPATAGRPRQTEVLRQRKLHRPHRRRRWPASNAHPGPFISCARGPARPRPELASSLCRSGQAVLDRLRKHGASPEADFEMSGVRPPDVAAAALPESQAETARRHSGGRGPGAREITSTEEGGGYS
jgi:hypothetical protein